jgi:predicted RecB family endonuclease
MVQEVKLSFARRAKFLYLPNQYGSERFWHALSDALQGGNGAYARAIFAVSARGGVMPIRHFGAAAGLVDAAGQLGPDEVRTRLVEAEVLRELDVPGYGICIALSRTAELDEPVQAMKARLVAEEVLLGAIKQWARNLAFGSYDMFLVRGGPKSPTVGRFEWDLTAPSYISGLTTWDDAASRPRPGSFVADVLLGRGNVDERAIRPFLYKTQTLRRLKAARSIQFFVSEGYTPEALNLLRKYGVVPARVEELFGLEVAKAMRELISTLTQTAAVAIDPDSFERLFNSLGRFEGAAGTLRGALFEYVAADLLRESGWHNIVMNKLYRENGRDLAEVDVRAEKADDVVFVECKGILPGKFLDDAEVEQWLTRRIPAVYAKTRANEELVNRKLVFELWTTGELSANAKALLEAKQQEVSSTKYTLQARLGPDLRQLAAHAARRNRTLVKVLDQHFLMSPLSELRLVTRAQTASLDKTAMQQEWSNSSPMKVTKLPSVGSLRAPE